MKNQIQCSMFLLFLVCISLSNAITQVKDFFPLTVGAEKHYSCLMTHTFFEYYPLGKNDYVKDSGTVAYKVLSHSVLNDTTIVWSIRESLNFKSIEYHRNSFGVIETTYYDTKRSIDFPLYEYTTGLHRLKATMAILRLYDNAYRYSDQQSDTLQQVIANYPSLSTYNTFVSNLGIVTMFNNYFFIGHSIYGSDKKEVTLLHHTSVSISEDPPIAFFLSQNYPNPFNPTTSIDYALPSASRVTLEIVSSLGQSVLKVHQGEQAAGHYRFAWNAHSLPTGVYYLRFITDNGIQSRKLLFLK